VSCTGSVTTDCSMCRSAPATAVAPTRFTPGSQVAGYAERDGPRSGPLNTRPISVLA
jgi:hypothetical protein